MKIKIKTACLTSSGVFAPNDIVDIIEETARLLVTCGMASIAEEVSIIDTCTLHKQRKKTIKCRVPSSDAQQSQPLLSNL